jgi:hypothetical protein
MLKEPEDKATMRGENTKEYLKIKKRDCTP